jgi:hypothetical protein
MNFWDFVLKTYWGGILTIILGVLLIFWVKKIPIDKDSGNIGDTKGLIAGVGFIIIGIGVIISKLIS